MTDPTPPPVADRIRVRTDLIASMRAEAARSDGQVGIVLAGAIAAAGFIATTWPPTHLPTVVAVLWWVGMGTAAGGITALGLSLFPAVPPRRPVAPPAAVFHCWDVLAAADAGVLGDALDRTPTAVAAADRQTHTLAAILAAKWHGNRIGLALLGTAMILLAATGITGLATS
ncbi:hypothetical protein [Frankia sp. AgB32]|uniref:hypothetical protein n=1 Tax=Frankia sp. AgB32 TaxID=631119 RepID=UPI00200E9FDC|nr:hypothetical protein [Frankia sp. AgB32]MCK9898370.1 hypothetical protein [Frankia sp. AgB32]